MHYGNPEDFQWDVVTGISAGSINAFAMAVWDKADGLAMSEWFTGMWQNLKTGNIYKLWPGGLIAGLTVESALFDD